MDRRELLQEFAAFGLVPAVQAAPAVERFEGIRAECIVQLPLHPGDSIVALTQFRDEIWAATRFGELYRVSDYL